MPNPWHRLPAEIQSALIALIPGCVIRVPKRPPRDLSERIRLEHDANVRLYGLTEGESVRLISKRHRLWASEVRRML